MKKVLIYMLCRTTGSKCRSTSPTCRSIGSTCRSTGSIYRHSHSCQVFPVWLSYPYLSAKSVVSVNAFHKLVDHLSIYLVTLAYP